MARYLRYAVQTRYGDVECCTIARARYLARGERADGWPTSIVRMCDRAEIPVTPPRASRWHPPAADGYEDIEGF